MTSRRYRTARTGWFGACVMLVAAAAILGLSLPSTARADLVGYWGFNEGTGSTLGDASTYTNSGTIYGSPTWVEGHSGLYGDYALAFDNNDAKYVQIPEDTSLHICNSLNRNCTVTMWVYDFSSYYGEAWSFGRNLFLQTANGYADPHTYVWSDNNAALRMTGPMIPKLGWSFVAWTYDGTTANLYIDGTMTPAQTTTPGNQNLTAWGDLYIGRQEPFTGWGGYYPWNGYLDDLLILDTTATTNELAQIKAGTYPGMPPLPTEPPPPPKVWITATSGGNWSDTANWQSNIVANGANQPADFSTLDIASNNTVHLDTARTIGDLIFGDTDTNSAAGWILDNNGDAANILTLAAGGQPTITVHALGPGKSLAILAEIDGSNGLKKNGEGALVLSGTNTYSGATTINEGSVSINSLSDTAPNSLGTIGTIAVGSATFQYTGHAAVSCGRFLLQGANTEISITQSDADLTITERYDESNIIKTGAGSLTMSGTVYNNTGHGNGGFGTVAVEGGTLVLAANVLDLYNWTTVGTIDDVKSGATLKLDTSGGGTDGQISRAGSFHMSGGILDLNGDTLNTVPVIDGSGTITNSAAATAATVTLNVNRETTFIGRIVDGAGTVALNLAQGGNTWTLSGTNSYSGTTTVAGGCTLKAGSPTAFSTSSAFVIGGALDLAGFNNTIAGLTGNGTVMNSVTGTATLTVNNVVSTNTADNTFGGVLEDGGTNTVLGLTKQGPGSLILSGTNTYTGDTTVETGTLSLAISYLADAADVYLMDGATLDLTHAGTDTIRSLYINGILQTRGTWGANGSGAKYTREGFFTGSGILKVVDGPFTSGLAVIVR